MIRPTDRFVAMLLTCAVLGASGCIEDQRILTINADGSGKLERTVVLSDRMVVAAEDEDDSGGSDMPVNADEMRQKIGDALTIETLTVTDQPDGSRRFEFVGTFDDVQELLASEFAQEELKLKLAQPEPGVVELGMTEALIETNSDSGPKLTMNKMYGLMKGAHMQFELRVPGPISKTSGKLGSDNRSAKWEIDLRDREGLAEARKIEALGDKARPYARFPASSWSVKLPEPAAASEAGDAAAQAETSVDAGAYAVEPVSVKWSKARQLDGEVGRDRSSLELEFVLTWPKGQEPQAIIGPHLTGGVDNAGASVVPDDEPGDRRRKVWRNDRHYFSVAAVSPAHDARFLSNIKGKVRVLAGVETKTVKLASPDQWVDKDKTGDATLDGFNFKIIKFEGDAIEVTLDGGKERIESMHYVQPDGVTEVKQSGYSGWKKTYTYNFQDGIQPGGTLVLNLVIEERIATVPFEVEKIELP